MTKTRFHFAEAIATLIPLASVLGRNNYRYEKLVEYLKNIFAECEKWKGLPSFEDENFFSNEVELSLDVTGSINATAGSLTLEEWKTVLSELQGYVNKTPVSYVGKFYRMNLFGKFNKATVLVSSNSNKDKGWKGNTKKIFHNFSSFPKNKIN